MVARNMVTITGRLGSAEEWSTRWNFGPNGVGPGPYDDPSDLADWALGAADAIEANFATVGNPLTVWLSAAGTIDSIRIDYLNVANDVVASGQSVINVAGANPVTHPYQTAVVFSLRTALPGGRNRGRCYFPYLGGSLESPAGNIASASALQGLLQFRDLMNAITDAQPVSDSVALGVASEAANTVTPVTQLQVGNFPDTQRRRRNGLVETYSNASYPA